MLLLISLPLLVGGWIFAGIGIYYLAAILFGYPTNEENESLAAISAFLFSFGAVSIAVLLAAKANFSSKAFVRQIYKYSIIVTAVLFLGYTVIVVMFGLIDLVIRA